MGSLISFQITDVMYLMILIDTKEVGWKHTLRLMEMESGGQKESL